MYIPTFAGSAVADSASADSADSDCTAVVAGYCTVDWLHTVAVADFGTVEGCI